MSNYHFFAPVFNEMDSWQLLDKTLVTKSPDDIRHQKSRKFAPYHHCWREDRIATVPRSVHHTHIQSRGSQWSITHIQSRGPSGGLSSSQWWFSLAFQEHFWCRISLGALSRAPIQSWEMSQTYMEKTSDAGDMSPPIFWIFRQILGWERDFRPF